MLAFTLITLGTDEVWSQNVDWVARESRWFRSLDLNTPFQVTASKDLLPNMHTFSTYSTGWNPSPNTTGPITPRFFEQYGGGAGIGGAGGLGPAGFAQTSGPDGFVIIPFLSVHERYDTNVVFAPPAPGLKRDDFVTGVSPQLFMRHAGGKVDTTLQVGANAEYYVSNENRNFVGFNAALNVGLDRVVQRFFPDARLRVSDTLTYTPQLPGFLGGNPVNDQVIGSDNSGQLPVADQYGRGIQAPRVTATANDTTIGGSIPFSPTIAMIATYSYSFVKFGNSSVPTGTSTVPALFESSTNKATVGPTYKATSMDTLSLLYSYADTQFDQASYQSHQGSLSWYRTLSQEFRTTLTGGAALVTTEGNISQSGTSSPTSIVTYTGAAALLWARRYTKVSINYSAGVYPSYVANPTPFLSQLVAVSGTHVVGDRLTLIGGGNYSRSDAIGGDAGAGGFGYTSYGTNEGIVYRLSPTLLASFIHTYAHVSGSGAGTSSTSAFSNEFVRNTLTLAITSYW